MPSRPPATRGSQPPAAVPTESFDVDSPDDDGATGSHPKAARIIAFSSITMTVTALGQTPGVSVFIDPLIRELSLTRAGISTVYSIASMLAAFAMPWVGRRIDRHGVRAATFLFGSLFGAVLLGLSQVWEAVGLGIGFVGIRLLGQGALNLTARVAVALRFRRNLGRAVGLSGALGAIGLSTMPVVISAVIERSDWRVAWAIGGVAVWLVLLPLTLWALPRTADMAMRTAHVVGRAETPDSWTRSRAIRTGIFWAISATVAANALVITGLAFHQISVLAEAGLSPTRAAANYLPQTIAQVSAIVVVGTVAHRVPGHGILASSMVFLILATLMLHFVHDDLTAILYALLLGTAGGTGFTAEGILYQRYFGTEAIAEIRGFGFTLVVGAAALGPIIVGLIEEATGGYAVAASVFMLIPIAVILLTIVARAPKPRDPIHNAA